MANAYYFALVFSASELEQKLYREGTEHIIVVTENHLRVQIPLRRLVPFITYDGIRGRFKLITDAQNRFVSLQKVATI
jgi:hypothetical protein